MIDEEPKALPTTTEQHDGELLLYDFFKHLVSLTLLTLGGVITIAGVADPKDVKRGLLIIVLIVIALGGISAFAGATEIVRARYTRQPLRPGLNFHRISAPALLSLGVGMFLSMFVDSLD